MVLHMQHIQQSFVKSLILLFYDLKIIIAHPGYDDIFDALRLALKFTTLRNVAVTEKDLCPGFLLLINNIRNFFG